MKKTSGGKAAWIIIKLEKYIYTRFQMYWLELVYENKPSAKEQFIR